uniref:Uncharacterized protein n=1 Tax=Cacopsylla melanoneura TaxID=428564 RepID=A0A8D8WH38_9HEMI
MRHFFLLLTEETQKVGLKINDEKTKFMEMNRQIDGQRLDKLEVGTHSFERTEEFKYLGVFINSSNTEKLEIINRIEGANKSFYACSKLLGSKLLSHCTKLRIYKTIIRCGKLDFKQRHEKEAVCVF